MMQHWTQMLPLYSSWSVVRRADSQLSWMRHGKAKVIHQQPMKQGCVPLELLLLHQELRAGGEDVIGAGVIKLLLTWGEGGTVPCWFCLRGFGLWLAKKKRRTRRGNPKQAHWRETCCSLSAQSQETGRGWGNSMSPFCSQLAGVGGGVELLLKCTLFEITLRTRCQRNTHLQKLGLSEWEVKKLLFHFTCFMKASLCPSVSALQTAGLPAGNVTVLALTLHPACFGSSLFLPESYFSGPLPALKLNL